MVALLTPSGLADLLQVSVGHVYRLVEQRRVPFIRIGGSIRFRLESVNCWIAGQEVRTVHQTISTLASSKNNPDKTKEKR